MTGTTVVGRGSAAIAVLLLLAFPVRAFLGSSDVPVLLKLLWCVLPVLGLARPTWGAATILALVPLVPIWPHLFGGVPFGVVHLVVIGQAVPTLGRLARGQRLPVGDVVLPAFALVAAVAFASLVSWQTAYVRASPAPLDAAADVMRLLARYVFFPPGPHLAAGAVAFTTFADGLLAYLVVRMAIDRDTAPRLITTAALAATLVAALGVAQLFTGAALQPIWLQFDAGIVRINSTYSDPNALGAYLAMLLAVAVGLAGAAANDVKRWGWLAAASLLGIALILTAGRMAAAAALLGLTVVVGRAHRLALPDRDRWRVVRDGFRPGVTAIGGAVVALLLVLAIVGTWRDARHADQDSYLDTALYTLNMRLPLDEKLKGRLTFWRSAGQMAADSPWFGIGIGRVFEVFPAYSQRTGGLGAGMSLSAHNTFLNVAAELGLFGLASWLACLAMIYATACRRGDEEDPATAWRRTGLAAGLVAFGATMVTGDRTILREDPVVFGAVCALAAALSPRAIAWAPAARRGMMVAAVVLAATLPLRIAADVDRVDIDRVEWGFHLPELDAGGRPFRWTEDRAVLHVARGAGRLVLPVRTQAPGPVTVTVRIDGRTADRTVLTDQTWHDLSYTLADPAAPPRVHRVEILVDPAVVWPGDRRRLGVMVGAYAWTAR